MSSIYPILKKFNSIGLDGMDKVRLMNRKESKYVLKNDDLLVLLDGLEKENYIVKVKEKLISPYKTRYYDLPKFNLYTAHQNGKLNRFKVRSRTYALTGTTFIEYKFKTNKRRTIKERAEINQEYRFCDCYDFLDSRLPFNPSKLEEKIQVEYNRITLVDKNFSGRVTIDTNLHFSSPKKESYFDDIAIIEIKKDENSKPLLIEKKLQEMRIKEFSISKYCLGISQLYPNVKKNLINIKIRKINKMLRKSETFLQTKVI